MSFSFNPDGSLAAQPRKRRDHLPLLLALEEVPFGMGQHLLTDHLRGKRNAKTAKLRLDRYMTNGELGGYQDEEIRKLIDHLERQGLIALQREKGIYPVYALTHRGQDELLSPKLELDINKLDEQEANSLAIKNPFPPQQPLTDQEASLINSLQDFFPDFNEQQRRAVIANDDRILCVAGAGSGKTSVLTKRIAFLITYRSVPPERILAITFTRKARREMQERLARLIPGKTIDIETFNSFSEKALQRHGSAYYGKEVAMASFRDQLQLLIETLKQQGQTPETITEQYFTQRQRQGKDAKTLFFSFAYDFHTLIDKLRITNASPDSLRRAIKSNQEHAALANTLLTLAKAYLQTMRERGMRDYTDQLLDTIDLYKIRPQAIPSYDHVLVDEYQDVNDQQLALIDLLKPRNLFVVGDPRQSIYGWRGSRISHILEFAKRHEDAKIIQLTTNYRSATPIVDLCNEVIKKTGYEDLQGTTAKGTVMIKRYASEEEQASAITKDIKQHPGDRKDIFVLSRTNKGLEPFQNHFQAHGIDYLLRTDELKRPSVEAKADQVTLATIHAIKGLEAETVYVINANSANFPCKASDHPVMDLFRLQEGYDSYAEELRVLYVALSRAKKNLHVSYTGTVTPFIPDKARKALEQGPATAKRQAPQKEAAAALMTLRQWRYQQAKERGVPAYVICPDAALEALLASRPTTQEELYAIPGLGPVRIQEHGEAILDLLARI